MKFWWVCLAFAVLLGGLQFYKSYVRYVPMYKCSATYTVYTQNSVEHDSNGVDIFSFFYDQNTADQLQKVFPYIVNNEIVKNKICADLNLDYVPASISASVLPNTNMITLTTTGKNPQETYDVLLSIVKNYSSVAEYIIGRTKLVTITAPEIPQNPFNAFQWRVAVAKGMLLGVVIGLVWIGLYAVLRKTIRTKDEIYDKLKLSCLGVLPQVYFKKHKKAIDKSILLNNPKIGNDFIETLRLIRSMVENKLNGEKVVMITSTIPGEGKSIVTVNFAAVCAKNKEKALVIDCDFRNSGIDRLLENCKMSEPNYENNSFSIFTVEELKIDILRFSAEARGDRRVFNPKYMESLLSEVKKKYDIVIIDTPPCGLISDAVSLAGVADGVLYVIRQDTAFKSSVQNAVNLLNANDANILGCVLNGASGGLGGYGEQYRYGGYHKYYYHRSNYDYYGK